jgi:GTP-binding protein LepA
LIFDSWFEHFRGAIALIVVTQGSVSVGQKIRSYNAQMEYEVTEVGIMHPNMIKVNVT